MKKEALNLFKDFELFKQFSQLDNNVEIDLDICLKRDKMILKSNRTVKTTMMNHH